MKNIRNKIIQGDSLEILKTLQDESVDLFVTSPPYNLRNTTGGKTRTKGKWESSRLMKSGYSATNSDDMPHDKYVEWQRNILTEMYRCLKDDGAIFYNHKWRVQAGLLQDRQDIVSGFPVRQIIIWKRKGGINFNKGYFLPTYEVIYLICKPKFKLADKANAHGDVWEIGQERNNPHPAPFPVELAERMIGSTNAQFVVDPFVGSGTTALAAKKLGRDYLGIDIEQEFVLMAEERLKSQLPDE